jgi:hypothetical protein
MEELNRLGNPVLDQHPLSIARHQRRATVLEVVGQQDGRLLVPQIDDRDLTQRPVVILQMDSFVQDPGGAKGPGQGGQSDPAPGRGRTAEDLAQHAPGPATECQETNTPLVQPVQVGVGGQLRIEHQLGRVLPGLLAPELDESQDFVGLFDPGDSGMGIAEDTMASIASQERQDALLAATPSGDVVLFQGFRLGIGGDGVEIEVEGRTPWQAGSVNFG